MALSLSARLGLTRWSAGSDPLARAQLDTDNSRLDALAAMDIQVATIADRPAAAIRGRYCWVADIRTLFRDEGATWHRVAETDSGGAQLLRRVLATDKAAGDLPSTYPLGLSSHDVGGTANAWPAANLTVVTQRSAARTMQTASQATTGRVWVRTQTAGADSWGRFTEVVETLRFTSTTRPTADLFDGLRGYETDTTGTVVYLAASNRWQYESFLNPPMWDFSGTGSTPQSIGNGSTVVYAPRLFQAVGVNRSSTEARVQARIPGRYMAHFAARYSRSTNSGARYVGMVLFQSDGTTRLREIAAESRFAEPGPVNASGSMFMNAGEIVVAQMFQSTGETLTVDDSALTVDFTGVWVAPLPS